jgi:hypothetical protein
MTPWTGDQPVARPLTVQDNINTEKADIHASSRIQTHDPKFERTKTFRTSDRAVYFVVFLKLSYLSVTAILSHVKYFLTVGIPF